MEEANLWQGVRVMILYFFWGGFFLPKSIKGIVFREEKNMAWSSNIMSDGCRW